MPTDAERLATIEQVVRDLRGDIAERKHEEERTRKRLHDIEGLLSMMVETTKEQRRGVDVRQRSLEVRMQVLTVVVGLAALIEPLLYALVKH